METTGLKPTDIAWVAGIFDGEGCVLIKELSSVVCSIENTHLPMLNEIHTMVGGKMRFRKPRAKRLSAWEWTIQGKGAFQFLNLILPYSRVKAQQIEKAIQFFDYPPKSQGRKDVDEALRLMKRIDYR